MKTTYQNFTLSSEFKGNKCWPTDDKQTNFNNHVITVIHEGARTSFEFWSSMMEPEINKEADLLHAFECFISDALAGKDSFKDFCSEFGYDTDSRNAERIYKTCVKACAKLERIYEGDLYALANGLREKIEI